MPVLITVYAFVFVSVGAVMMQPTVLDFKVNTYLDHHYEHDLFTYWKFYVICTFVIECISTTNSIHFTTSSIP
jgi:hypothetical protein